MIPRMPRNYLAAERKPLDTVLRELPAQERYARTLAARLGQVCALRPGMTLLEIGAASGSLVHAFRGLGFDCVGVEPFAQARRNCALLAKALKTSIPVVQGRAEALPFADASFDGVVAVSVLEHVEDLEMSFAEAARVLKPRGAFWFSSTSAVCPRQVEISGFPLFGIYPRSAKLKIMAWAKRNRPDLIGYTETPAINWFTPRMVRRLALEYGFEEVYNRWELHVPDHEPLPVKALLAAVKRSKPLQYLADFLVPDCSYALVKQ